MGKILLKVPEKGDKTQAQYEAQQVAFSTFVASMSEAFGKYTDKQLEEAQHYFSEMALQERQKNHLADDAHTISSEIANSLWILKLYRSQILPQQLPGGDYGVSDNSYAVFTNTYNTMRVNTLQVDGRELTLRDALFEFCQEHGFQTMNRGACKLVNDLAQNCENLEQTSELLEKSFDTELQTEVEAYCKDVNGLQISEKNLVEDATKNNVDLTKLDELLTQAAQVVQNAEKEYEDFRKKEIEYMEIREANRKDLKNSREAYEALKRTAGEFKAKVEDLENLDGNLHRYCEGFSRLEKQKQKAENEAYRLRMRLDEDKKLPDTIKSYQDSLNFLKPMLNSSANQKLLKQYNKAVQPLQEKVQLADEIKSALATVDSWTDKDAKANFDNLNKKINSLFKGTAYLKEYSEWSGALIKKNLKEGGRSIAGAYKDVMERAVNWKGLTDQVNQIRLEQKTSITKISSRSEYIQPLALQQKIEATEGMLQKLIETKPLTSVEKVNMEADLLTQEQILQSIPGKQMLDYASLCEKYGLPKPEKLPFKEEISNYLEAVEQMKPVFRNAVDEIRKNPPVTAAQLEESRNICEKYQKIDQDFSQLSFDNHKAELKNNLEQAVQAKKKLESLQNRMKECCERNNTYAKREAELRKRSEVQSSMFNKASVYESIKWFKDHANDAIKSKDYSNSKAYKAMMRSVDAALTAIEDNSVNAKGKTKAIQDLKNATDAYLAKKHSQHRLNPSTQRRTRLRYAERLSALAGSVYKDMTALSQQLPANEVIQQFVDKRNFCSEKQPEEYTNQLADRVREQRQPENGLGKQAGGESKHIEEKNLGAIGNFQ